MVMTATTNTSANTALRYLDNNSRASASSLAKLSSGSRIVRASDDAASLAVGTKLKADVTALKQASVNASQASSVLQVADGALAQTVDILMRMKALSVQSQSGSVSDNERGFLDKEFQALAAQIDSIAAQTKFNGQALLNGGELSTAPTGAGVFDTTAADHIAVTENRLADGTTFAGPLAWTLSESSGDGTDDTATFAMTDNAGKVYRATAMPLSATFSDSITLMADDGASFTLSFQGAQDVDTTAAGNVAGTLDFEGQMSFQVGVSSTDTIGIELGSITTSSLGGNIKAADGTLDLYGATLANDTSGGPASVATRDRAIVAGNVIDAAIAQLNTDRADVGARISRFEFASANLATTIENLDASRSVLMDVDMAAEMSNFSSKQVLLQASVAMLAQANQQPQQLLQLLQ